jgi:hypothetical protein
MADGQDVAARRQALHELVTALALDLSRAVREARSLNLPVEPGVREGGAALARWAVLLDQVIP